jgi:predicted O-linked N-acetylglucosamine transferase (SPINDLY family)
MPSDSTRELFARGNALFGSNDFEGAAQCYRRAIELDPCYAAASFNLACALDRLAGPAEALPHFAKAASLRPDWCEARSSHGFALARSGSMREAVAEFEAAVALKPDHPGVRNDLALALSALDRGEEAFAAFREAIRLDPLAPEPHNNLAVLFEHFGRTSEAIASCLEALELRPDYPEAHSNLASALKSQGRHEEALEHYREALRLKQDLSEARDAMLLTLCYPATVPEEAVVAEHLAFGAPYCRPLPCHDNDRSPHRPLRIGYVSADFRSHAVFRFIAPVLRHHDRRSFQVFCYSNVTVADSGTERIAALCDRFVKIAGTPDAAAAELIRGDGIDILVDLSGHTAGNRLSLFALKPAPIQVTWLGYPHTTGLTAIDYRITDAVCDPPELTERHHCEKLLRLPGNFSCFGPDENAPEVAALPSLSSGVITFGSFNNPAKITPETVALWAAALHGVPGSRMMVKGYSLADRGSRDRLLALFEKRGIAAERLELIGNTASYHDHLALYGKVDLALDTFPYNGTTTTCEALWMGVPVVTLAGATHRSRVGASVLPAVGLQDLVAREPQEFPQVAVRLALDQGRLVGLRKGLRSAMAASRLTDAARFTVELEAAYRNIWEQWCGKWRTEPHPHPGPPLEREGVKPLQRHDVPSGDSARLRSLPFQGGGQEGDGGAATSAEAAATGSRLAASAGNTSLPFQGGGQAYAPQGASARRQEGDGVARGGNFLQQDNLDCALTCFLSALGSDHTRASALAGIQQVLNRQIAVDLSDALDRDAVRLGAVPVAAQVERVQDETLEETAAALLNLNLVTPADLICRYLHDRGRRTQSIYRTLGDVALAIGQPQPAAAHFRNAIAAGDGSVAMRIKLVKAEASARVLSKPPGRERFLLIKSWGFGFWSDVSHVLGQLLVAEITERVPVIHWGRNSLFSEQSGASAFQTLFDPVSRFTLTDLAAPTRSFYPPKWNRENIGTDLLSQREGAWSRMSSLHALSRPEEVIVSDFHHSVNDLVPWIPDSHHLHGMTTEQIYLYLFRRYLRVKPALQAEVDDFFDNRMAGRVHLALHVRGGDKAGEDPNLARLNALYHLEIDRFLQRVPQGRLFLMTDDRGILSAYLQCYGSRIVHTGATRTEPGRGVHYQKGRSPRRLAEEVMIDTLLATRCDFFVGNGLSNVSCAVAQMKEWAEGTLTLLGSRLDRLRHLTMYRS